MELNEFVALVPNFSKLSAPDKIVHPGWFLHTQRNRERFDVDTVRQCFNNLHMEVSKNLARDVARLAERKSLLKDAGGITIARREDFDDLKESEVIDPCGIAGLFASDNTKRIPGIQLTSGIWRRTRRSSKSANAGGRRGLRPRHDGRSDAQ
jgi:hypothetical protein